MPTSKTPAAPRLPILLYADTQRSADQYYLGRVQVPDPFVAICHRGQKTAIVSALEFARVRKEGAFRQVWPLEEFVEAARREHPDRLPRPSDFILRAAHKMRLETFRIPADFPAQVAFELQAAGLRLETAEGQLFPQRACKDDAEAAAISRANAVCSTAFRAVEKILSAAVIRKGVLHYEKRPLTSERLRLAIGQACLAGEAAPGDPIVASGDEACDPHARGSGPIRAHSLIIVDIFPRLTRTLYHGDMTRTYLKGTPSEAQKRLVNAVREAQKRALLAIRAGVDGEAVYRVAADYFTAAGFETKKENGINVGFFHGLGHGLGLEVHEPPRMAPRGPRLEDGYVVTVEPGLYYPGLGGCRFEDVVRVRKDGLEMLSRHPYRWCFPG